jgi:methyl-accepting chemotaxis protein
MTYLHSISFRLVMAVAGMGVVAALVLGAFSLLQQGGSTELSLHQQLDLQFQGVLAAFEYEGRSAQSVATAVANIPGVAEAMEREDRDTLQRLLGPLYDAVKPHGFSFFNMTKPPATLVLRVHDPKAFGDDVSARRKSA